MNVVKSIVQYGQEFEQFGSWLRVVPDRRSTASEKVLSWVSARSANPCHEHVKQATLTLGQWTGSKVHTGGTGGCGTSRSVPRRRCAGAVQQVLLRSVTSCGPAQAGRSHPGGFAQV